MHYWYSKKQKRVRTRRNMPSIFCIINGHKVEYTERNEKDKPAGSWDDYEYLGREAIK